MYTHRSGATLSAIVLAAFIGLSFPAFSRAVDAQSGTCRNTKYGPCPGAPKTDTTKCDPAAWKRYMDEERAVRSIAAQWYAKERAINAEEAEALKEFLKDELIMGTAKEVTADRVIEKSGKAAEDYFKYQAEFTTANLDKMSRGLELSKTVVVKANVTIVLFKAAEKALYMEEIVRKAGNESEENKKTIERANKLWEKALEDLLQALAQNAACKKERAAAAAKEKLRDQAEAMIEKWQPEGTSSGMYFYNNERYDYGGALKKAEDIIKSGKPVSGKANSPLLWLAVYTGPPPIPSAMGYLLTGEQLDGAKSEVKEAHVRIPLYFAAFRRDFRRRLTGRQQIHTLMPH